MKEYKYRKIDAFTSQNSLGNPAACIYLDEGQTLCSTHMLEIAKQHSGFVSEVIYCTPNSNSGFKLTYYSSECEVDFCGHGTIACMYSLISESPELLTKKEITISTNKKGDLTVYNDISKNNSIYISAPNPVYIGTNINIDEIALNLQLNLNQIDTSKPIDMIDAGLKTLIVPLVSLKDEISIFPNIQNIKKLCLQNDIDIILIYSLETHNSKCTAHTRVFAPKFGYLEDPATGSGNSAFGYYMLKNNLWNGKHISIEQGGMNRIFNIVNLLYSENHLLFGGSATTRIKGVYCY